MNKTVVAGVLAVAAVFSLAGCSGTSAAAGDHCMYVQEHQIADSLRQVISSENSDLSDYVNGALTADELAQHLDVLTASMNALNKQEAGIKGACAA